LEHLPIVLLIFFLAVLFLTFEQSVYEVVEGAGMINNLVFVQKQDGRASEQILPIQVQLQLGSAIRGQCCQVHAVTNKIQAFYLYTYQLINFAG
jgi:hypothetical protein